MDVNVLLLIGCNMSKFNFFDKICLQFDQVLKTLSHTDLSARATPAKAIADNKLSKEERHHAAGLMRINHAGEVCAQALYHGQSLTARLPNVREQMAQAAQEEYDHLAWCKQRISELGSHVSYLNPLWYAGSFAIGALAGALGDKWSLGFVVETERQVVAHLQAHAQALPANDQKSHAVIQQMQKEEEHHRQQAYAAGAAELPVPVKMLMNLTSKVMTKTAYWF